MNKSWNAFAANAADYANFRPIYPAALYQWLLTYCGRRDAAWDCATGNGQAAVSLSAYFASVYATDISNEQLQQAMTKPNIHYFVQRAEETAFPDQSIDVVVVAQALHWFNYQRFWPEVARIARDDAFFCAWGYSWPHTPDDIAARIVVPFRQIIDPFWSRHNQLLWDGYADSDIAFPLERIEAPPFSLDFQWRLDRFLAYLMTWSAYQRSRASEPAVQAMDRLMGDVQAHFDPALPVPVAMPLTVVAGRIGR